MKLQHIFVMIFWIQTCEGSKKNVLFIIADDLRPELGVYNGEYAPTPVHPRMFTPNIDALAGESLLLRRAYVQYPLCNPSRSSMLTGRRPETISVYDLKVDFRDTSKVVTLPELFKRNGYETLGLGKVYHDQMKDLPSWTMHYFKPRADSVIYPDKGIYSWTALSNSTLQKRPMEDQRTNAKAISLLRDFAPGGAYDRKPFFMAVGYRRPHAPLMFPEHFLQYYPEEEIRLPNTRDLPKNFPPVAWSTKCSFFKKKDFPYYDGGDVHFNETISDQKALEVRRAYYCTVSYIDSLVGELLKELDDSGLRDNTVVVFVGDHGFHLGEHKQWCKRTNFEESLRTPAMIRVPGLTDGGKVTDKLAEFVDIYPTVVEAAGLEPVPLCPPNSADVEVCREGTSWMPLIQDPEREDWKEHVFSQVIRDREIYNLPYPAVMGKSVRTTNENMNYRYTEWVHFDTNENRAVWEDVMGAELYDLTWDPQETINVVNSPLYEEIVDLMRNTLRLGWRNTQINEPITDEFAMKDELSDDNNLLDDFPSLDAIEKIITKEQKLALP